MLAPWCFPILLNELESKMHAVTMVTHQHALHNWKKKKKKKKKKGRKKERTKANPTNYNWLNACSEFTLQHILLRIIIPFTPKNARRKLLMINTRNVAIAL